MRYLFVLPILFAFVLTSCKSDSNKNETNKIKEKAKGIEKTIDRAQVLLTETIAAHGGALYDDAHYGFTFRDKRYTFKHYNGNYTYSVEHQNDGTKIHDILQNGRFERTLNGKETVLSKKDIAKYTEALNSVVYFTTLPYKLKDEAVNKTHEGQMSIKGRSYEMLAVTFDQEGGGIDYDDEFLYWINANTKQIDYLAYNYQTSDGGVRFRSTYNHRVVDGIHFQDYINYKAPLGTPLKNLPKLYEEGKLEELSRIETENVINLKN